MLSKGLSRVFSDTTAQKHQFFGAQLSLLCVRVLCAQSCPTLCDPVGCSPPGPSVRGILQARTLAWAAIPLRGSTCIVNSNVEGWGLTSLSQEEGVWTRRGGGGSELLPLLGGRRRQPGWQVQAASRLPQPRGPDPLSGFPLRSPLACLFHVINRPLCSLGVSGCFC